MIRKFLLPLILALNVSCASQQDLFAKMKARDGYDCFFKSNVEQFKHYKCFWQQDEKQEWFAVNVEGSPVQVITCCSFWSCYATVVPQQ